MLLFCYLTNTKGSPSHIHLLSFLLSTLQQILVKPKISTSIWSWRKRTSIAYMLSFIQFSIEKLFNIPIGCQTQPNEQACFWSGETCKEHQKNSRWLFDTNNIISIIESECNSEYHLALSSFLQFPDRTDRLFSITCPLSNTPYFRMWRTKQGKNYDSGSNFLSIENVSKNEGDIRVRKLILMQFARLDWIYCTYFEIKRSFLIAQIVNESLRPFSSVNGDKSSVVRDLNWITSTRD